MPAAHKTARIIEPQRSILVFQGGGALGAYQAGVFEAFEASGRQPDWVVGTSIGAINAALIAGNPPKRRLERIRGVLGSHVATGDWPRCWLVAT